MTFLDDIICCEYLIPLSIIIIYLLPLVPINKFRYYTCYISYAIIVTLGCIMVLPITLMRPRNYDNLRIASVVIKHYTKVLGIKWTLRGGDVLSKDRTAMIVANHQSIFDIMGMFNIWEVMAKCTVIAKQQLLYVFPFGPMAWVAGLVFIERANPKIAMTKIEAALRHLSTKKAKLWMFPEGTRNKKGKALMPFKNGAFRVAICTQSPILPIVYSPYYFIDSVNKTFSKGEIIVSVLEAIPTEGLTMDDIDSLREKTYSLMAEEYEKLQEEIKRLQH